MKNRFFSSIVFLGLSVLVFTSCSSVPQAEIDLANAAIDSAKVAGAEVYVQDNFVALQDSMNHVMVTIEAEKSKFMGSYTVAKEKLAEVTQLASVVKQQAEVRKVELKSEVESQIEEVKTLIATDNQLITEAPKGKEGETALLAIKAEVDAVETSINETIASLETESYLVSLDKVSAAKEKATAINAELTSVIEKYKGKKK